MSSFPLRVGVQVQPQHTDFDGMRSTWTEAEALGVDSLWTWDHFYPLYGDPDGAHFEALTTLGAMAQVTERATVGALVICNSYRNPEYLVDAHRTLDHVSGGRAVLGIGAGWFKRDYDEYGYEFGDAPARLRALREALPRIEARRAKLNPQPVGALPILIGGSGEKVTLKLVARHANAWHGFGDTDVHRHKAEVLAGHCAAEGRDPAEIERTWAVNAGQVDKADALRDAGVTHFIMGVGGDRTGYDLGSVRELVQWRDAQR